MIKVSFVSERHFSSESTSGAVLWWWDFGAASKFLQEIEIFFVDFEWFCTVFA